MFTWLFDHLMTSAQLFLAGAWAGIWHKGVLYGVIATCVGLAFGSQFLAIIPLIGDGLVRVFAPLRKDLLEVAFCAGLLLVGEYIGSYDTAAQYKAKTVVIETVVNKSVAKTKTPTARAAKDPWDNPNN